MRNIKAELFKKALAEWDRFKDEFGRQLKDGKISEEEYHRLMSAKAAELDL